MTRRPVDLSLYLVTDTGLCGPRGVTTTVEAAVAGGATMVQLRDSGAIVGLSISTIEQVRAARGFGDGVLDYLGVGPVWPTATKPDHGPAIGSDGVATVCAAEDPAAAAAILRATWNGQP